MIQSPFFFVLFSLILLSQIPINFALTLQPQFPEFLPSSGSFPVSFRFSDAPRGSIRFTCDILDEVTYAWFGKGSIVIQSTGSGEGRILVQPNQKLMNGKYYLIKLWPGSDLSTSNYEQKVIQVGGIAQSRQEIPVEYSRPSVPVSQPSRIPVQRQPVADSPDSIRVDRQVSVPSSGGGSPFSGREFYSDPYSLAAQNSNRGSEIQLIASQPAGKWFGDWNSDIFSDVSKFCSRAASSRDSRGQPKIPILVAYNIPNRDCGGYSSGGVSSADSYRDWITRFASGIGNREALVILEPDALPHTTGQCSSLRSSRLALIRSSLAIFRSTAPNARVYLDIGHPQWLSTGVAAQLLQSAGVSEAAGFSINVANYVPTSECLRFGSAIAKQIGKSFVVDTSRNGKGPMNGGYCNLPGKAIGERSTGDTGNNYADAFVWVKLPGESDGNCNGAMPQAGQFFPSYAKELVQNAKQFQVGFFKSGGNGGQDSEMELNEVNNIVDSNENNIQSITDKKFNLKNIQVQVEVNI